MSVTNKIHETTSCVHVSRVCVAQQDWLNGKVNSIVDYLVYLNTFSLEVNYAVPKLNAGFIHTVKMHQTCRDKKATNGRNICRRYNTLIGHYFMHCERWNRVKMAAWKMPAEISIKQIVNTFRVVSSPYLSKNGSLKHTHMCAVIIICAT